MYCNLKVQPGTFGVDQKSTNPDVSIENFVPALPYSFGKHGANVVVSYQHTQEINTFVVMYMSIIIMYVHRI